MARRTISLAALEVEKAKPKNKEYSLNDGNNFGLRIKPSGTKS